MKSEKFDITRKTLLGKIIFAKDYLSKETLDEKEYRRVVEQIQHEEMLSKPMSRLEFDNIKQFEGTAQTKKLFREIMLAKEAHMMMLVIYLVELIGNKKSHGYSLKNDPVLSKDERWLKFYGEFRKDIDELVDMRNSLYAHLDLKALMSQQPVDRQ